MQNTVTAILIQGIKWTFSSCLYFFLFLYFTFFFKDFFIILFGKNLSFPQKVRSNDTSLSLPGFVFHQNDNIK